MLSNGSLAVGLNHLGLVHDFYYPYVGLENLTTARSAHHKLGVWVDDQFSWVDTEYWQVSCDFEENALVSDINMRNEGLQIELSLKDFVYTESNVFARQITVTNLSDRKREVRVFMHQVFQISNQGRADTAIWEPDENYILDYKGRCSLLIYARCGDQAADQFAIGNYGLEGKAGTFMDAEDGELSCSPIEHAGVDSVLRISREADAQASFEIEYWVVAADDQFHAEKIHHKILHSGLGELSDKTRDFWHDWLSIAQPKLDTISPEYIGILKKSLMVIKSHIDKRGGIIASCDSSIYNYGRDYYSYVWPRDGAFAIWPLIHFGYTEEAKKFFVFCRDVLNRDGYIMHKYQADKAIGSSWHPLLQNHHHELGIQEDETAIVIYMLGEYVHHCNDENFAANMYDSLIRPAANFLTRFRDEDTQLPHASYDLWEEKFLTTTYSVAVVYRSLIVAADFARDIGHERDARKWQTAADEILSRGDCFFDTDKGYYIKGFLQQPDSERQIDETLDVSSLYGVMTFGYFKDHADHQKLYKMAEKLETELLDYSPSGGISRYMNDQYFRSEPAYRGNPWIVTTLWMAQYYIRIGEFDKAKHYIDWTLQKALPSGMLSEQINPSSSALTSVAPLIWSHAELINTILGYSEMKDSNK